MALCLVDQYRLAYVLHHVSPSGLQRAACRYESEVGEKRGFGILFDFLQTQHAAQRKRLCQDLTRHWLQASEIYAWSLSMRSDLYFQNGFIEPSDPSALDTWPLETRSKWACVQSTRCLVPMAPGEVADPAYPKQAGACRSGSFFRVCGNGGSTVTTMVPLACFSVSFAKLNVLSRRFWTLTFRSKNDQNVDPGAMDHDYNASECNRPLIQFIEGYRSLEQARRNLQQACRNTTAD